MAEAQLYLEYDPAVLSDVRGHRTAPNSGCPPNYAAEFVPPGAELGIPYDPASPGGTWIRCRYVPGITADDIQAETGTSLGETADIFTGAVSDTVGQIKQTIQAAIPGFALGSVGLIVAGIAVLAVLYGPRR